MNITGANIRIWNPRPGPAQVGEDRVGGAGRQAAQGDEQPRQSQAVSSVPRMWTKIKEIHNAAINADLDTLDAKSDPPDILTAKDHNGLNPLHKASALGTRRSWSSSSRRTRAQCLARTIRVELPCTMLPWPRTAGKCTSICSTTGRILYIMTSTARPPTTTAGSPTTLTSPWCTRPQRHLATGTTSTSSGTGSPGRRRGPMGGHAIPAEGTPLAMTRSRKKDAKSRRNSLSDSPTMTFKDMKDVSDADIEQFIRDGDVDSLECVVAVRSRGGPAGEVVVE
nr:uncharacterized protein LOC113826936 [Penaeus vannamei]